MDLSSILSTCQWHLGVCPAHRGTRFVVCFIQSLLGSMAYLRKWLFGRSKILSVKGDWFLNLHTQTHTHTRVCDILRQSFCRIVLEAVELLVWTKLVLNWRSPCFRLLRAGFTGVYWHAWLCVDLLSGMLLCWFYSSTSRPSPAQCKFLMASNQKI